MNDTEVIKVVPKKGLTKEQITNWKNRIMIEAKAALSKRAEDREPEWERSVAQYNARTKMKGGSPRGADMDYPISYELAEQAKAHLVNPVLAYPQMFFPVERGRDFFDIAKSQESVSDWITDQTDWVGLLDDFGTMSEVFGPTFGKITWKHDTQKLRRWDNSSGVPEEITEDVTIFQGADVRAVHTPNMLWPSDPGENIQKMRWIMERSYEYRDEVKRLEKEGVYEKDFSKGSGEAQQNVKLMIGGGTEQAQEEEERFELWEGYATLPTGEEVVFTVDIDREKWGRLVYNWRYSFPRPYEHFGWKKRIGTIDATSLMQLLEACHRAYQAIMNMSLDSGSHSLEKLILASKELGLGKYFKDGRLDTGLVEVEEGIASKLSDSFATVRLAEGFPALQWLLERVVEHMHRVSATPEAFFGKDVASRPTAYGTKEVLGNAKQPINFMLERFRKFLSAIHTQQYALYRQHWPEGIEYYVRTRSQEEQQLIWQSMQWPEGVWQQQIAFELTCSSEKMSRDIRRQELMALAEQIPLVLNQVMQFAQPAVSGEPVAMLAAQAAAIVAGIAEKVLDEFDVEGGEMFDVVTGINVGRQFQETVTELQKQNTQLQNQLTSMQDQIAIMQGMPPPGQGPMGPGPGGPPGPQGPPGMGGGGPLSPPPGLPG